MYYTYTKKLIINPNLGWLKHEKGALNYMLDYFQYILGDVWL